MSLKSTPVCPWETKSADVSEIMVFEDNRIFRAMVDEDVDNVATVVLRLVQKGRDVNIKDKQGKTLLHHLVEMSDKFSQPKALPVVYQLCLRCELDIDAKDSSGETCLHKLMRRDGEPFKILLALMRCGVDSQILDNNGRTAEVILLTEKPAGWETMYFWYKKFCPGIKHVLHKQKTDTILLEKLLRSWCRVKLPVVSRNGSKCSMFDVREFYKDEGGSDDIKEILSKYVKTNEVVISCLAGDAQRVESIMKRESRSKVDINTKDFSYRDSIQSPFDPQPLIMAASATGFCDVIEVLLKHGADVNSPQSTCKEGRNHSKPLFFEVITGESSITKSITSKILEASNLNLGNWKGQTVLYEAMLSSKSTTFLYLLMSYGVEISARDNDGQTARDFAMELERNDYVQCIDEFVIRKIFLTEDTDYLTRLILHGYDHVTDLVSKNGMTLMNVASDRRRHDVTSVLESLPTTVERVKSLQDIAYQGNLDAFKTNVDDSTLTSRDHGGRTLLHLAILSKNTDLAKCVIKMCPSLVKQNDSMLRTPLHYAYLLSPDSDIISTLLENGASDSARDVFQQRAAFYKKSECGTLNHDRLLKEVTEVDLTIFLVKTSFEKRLLSAIQNHDANLVADLVDDISPYSSMERFSFILFDCLTCGCENIAIELIKSGCKVDIWRQIDRRSCLKNKQADSKDSNDLKKVSLRSHALQLGYNSVVAAIDRHSEEGQNKTSPRDPKEQIRQFQT